MKYTPYLLVLLLLGAPLVVFLSPESPLEELEKTSFSAASQWLMDDAPEIQNGWSPTVWQPDPKGAIWEMDFSPDGSMLAAVEISDNRLFVWNVSDGRVILWIHHENILVDVQWLSNDWVLVADGDTDWFSYQVIDDGSSRPQSTTNMRTGKWTNALAGTYNGWLWGMDVSINNSKVTFCGDIDQLNMGGEIVIADLSYFTDGNAPNAQHFFPQYWTTDCAISPSGATVAATGRNMTFYADGNVTYRDVVYGVDSANGALLWTRFVGGDNSSAWAVTWEPGGGSYTVGYNHPVPSQPTQWEAVVTAFAESDGTVFWYSPIPQNLSSLSWLPDGSHIGVGLYDPGRISFIDTAGQIQTDFGWHAVMSGTSTLPTDVTAVASTTLQSATTSANQLLASAGKDGGIEIWVVDVTQFDIQPYRKLGPTLVREISVHPSQDLVALAESNGVLTIRYGSNGSIYSQCFHPEYGQLVYEIPYAKSVGWMNGEAVGAFSDGVVITCNEFGKWSWTFDLRNFQTVGAFGRIASVPNSNYAAITWSSNTTDSTRDGHVAIIDPASGQFLKEWQYPNTHWAIDFNDQGNRLASASQLGDVRMWNTSDPNPANWIDDGVAYSHSGYVGVVKWIFGTDVLVTAGWDKQVTYWDILSQMQMMTVTTQFEPFGFADFTSNGQSILATGNASNSLTGQLEFYDMQNSTLLSTYQMNHIPRGLGVLPVDQSIVMVNHTGTFQVIEMDADGDGWPDVDDALPNDPTQHEDFDGDGWGDDQSQPTGDACVSIAGTSSEDRNGCVDSDGDGYSDPDATWLSHPFGAADAYPNNPQQWHDTDGDGHGDEYSFQVGSDGLRQGESGDAFANDPSQYRDLDGDGCGDNYSYTDDTGMRVNEAGDAFISDATQCNDFDGDGYGDNYSFTNDSGGLRVENGDAFPADYLAWSDLDGDGCPTDSATGLAIDLYPTDGDYCDEELPFWLPMNLQILISNDAVDWQVQISWDYTANNTDMLRLEAALGDGITSPSESDYFSLQVWTSSVAVSETLTVDSILGKDTLFIRFQAIPDDGEILFRNWSAVWVEDNDSGELNINLDNLLLDGPNDSGYERHNQSLLSGIHVEQCTLLTPDRDRLGVPVAANEGEVVVCGALLVKMQWPETCRMETWVDSQGNTLPETSPNLIDITPCPEDATWKYSHAGISETPMDDAAPVSRRDPGYPIGGAIAFPGAMCDTDELNEGRMPGQTTKPTGEHWTCVDGWKIVNLPDSSTDNNQNSGVQENESEDVSLVWYTAIAAMTFLVVLLGVMGLRYNRKTSAISSQVYSGVSSQGHPPEIPPEPMMHAPCKTCGGHVQEVAHQNARWTWCPSCREWQDYLGK